MEAMCDTCGTVHEPVASADEKYKSDKKKQYRDKHKIPPESMNIFVQYLHNRD
jgi:hypothetical protein